MANRTVPPESPDSEEVQFLRGPQTRSREFLFVLRVCLEFVRGFRRFHFLGPCVTIFGSARFAEDHPYYQLAREIGHGLAKAGFTVVTGGGPGIMEAANRGAREAGGQSIGANIRLEHEQHPNRYLDVFMNFKYFFVRKVMLVKYSYAFIVMPGGFGTMDEAFETATLIQTHKIKEFPIVMVAEDFWFPLNDFMIEKMLKTGTIDQQDLDKFHFTNSAEAVVAYVKEAAIRRFGLTYGPRIKRRWWFGEGW